MLGWPVTILALGFMFPWARWLLHRAEGRAMLPAYNPLLLALTTLGLSVGTLSLVMLWIGLLGVRIDWRIAAAICAVISLAGFLLRDKPYLLRDTPDVPVPPRPLANLARAAWIVIAILCALIAFNAVYWPFSVDDAVTIYASFGKNIATSGQLPLGNLYELYPMLVPLNYAFVFQASGWVNEYLAALIPALLSIGVVGVAYQLGRELGNRTAGLIAALLIVLAPMFTHWASTGYVDLPCGFYYGMALLFLVRLDRSRSWVDALLAGIMAGLAAWTKNSGLLIIPMIALWLIYSYWHRYWLSRRSSEHRAVKFTYAALIAAGFAAVAAPWYTHNLIAAGMLVPPTGWTWKAERTVTNLFPYIVDQHYGIVGWILMAGLLVTLWRLLQSRARDDRSAFLIIFTVPFFAIWWALFSYDDRFLLVLTVPVAVMAAQTMQALWRRLPAPARFAWLPYSLLLIVVLALPAASSALDFKFDVVRHPLMSDTEKHQLRLGKDRYQTALYLRTLAAGSKVLTQDLLLPFNADGMRMTVELLPTSRDQLAEYDYWVLSPGDTLPEWFGAPEPLHSEGGYRVYSLADR